MAAPAAATGSAYPPFPGALNPSQYPGYNPYAWGPAPAELPPPGKLHPPRPSRPYFSTAGRVAPNIYLAGWLLTLIGLAGTAAWILAAENGYFARTEPSPVVGLLALALAILSAGILSAAVAQSKQRRADGWLDFWGPSPILTVFSWLSLSTCAQLVLVLAIEAVHLTMSTVEALVLIEAANVLCFVGIVQLVVVGQGAMTWSDIMVPRQLPLSANEWWQSRFAPLRVQQMTTGKALTDLVIGFGLAIPCLIGTVILIAILVAILGVSNTSATNGIPSQIYGTDIWWVLLAAAVLAPLGEELFFRGYATNAWTRSLTRNSALVRAAILFASIHLINLVGIAVPLETLLKLAILGVAARFPVAAFLSWIYVARRSIFASLALHAAYNGILIWIVWEATSRVL